MVTTYRVCAIAGRRYELAHTEALRVPGHYAGTLYAFDGVTVPLRAAAHDLCWSTAVSILGTSFRSRYSHGRGVLHLGTYRDADAHGVAEATPHVALWTDGEVALWTETELRGRDWLADLLGELRPRRDGTSVVASGADPAAFHTVEEEVLVTVRDVGAVQLYPASRWRSSAAVRGLRTRAGELYRGGMAEPHVALRDGRERVVEKLFLRSSSAVAKLDLVDTDPDAAARFMAGFARLRAS